MVMIRGHLVTPEWAQWNAQYHLRGFDDLHPTLRKLINYAPTPDSGARPTSDLIAEGGPWHQMYLTLGRNRA